MVEVVEVDTQLLMTGVTAAQFNTADQKAAFAQAVEASLSDSAEVMNAVATDVARRRLGGRKLQQNGNAIVVSYTLKKSWSRRRRKPSIRVNKNKKMPVSLEAGFHSTLYNQMRISSIKE